MHAIIKIPLEFSAMLASKQMISQWAKVDSQGDQPGLVSYSGRCPTQRQLLGAAHCRPEELKGPSSAPLFIASQDG